MSPALTYVYCIVRSAAPPSLRAVPRAMPGGEAVRLIEVALTAGTTMRHWMAVSSVPERAYGEAALERGLQRFDWVGQRALVHEAVVEHFLDRPALLPMQLFTIFKSDGRAVEDVLRNRRRLSRLLARIERQAEWGVRAVWDPVAAGREAAPHTDDGQARRRVPQAEPGARYLAQKRDARDRVLELEVRARTDAHRLYRAMAAKATKSRRRTDLERSSPGSRLLLDAAFLVPKGRARAFQAAARRHAAALERSNIAVSLTGPWPAYNFI